MNPVQEIVKAATANKTPAAPKDGEGRQEYLVRVVRIAAYLPDSLWDELSKATQDWVNEAVPLTDTNDDVTDPEPAPAAVEPDPLADAAPEPAVAEDPEPPKKVAKKKVSAVKLAAAAKKVGAAAKKVSAKLAPAAPKKKAAKKAKKAPKKVAEAAPETKAAAPPAPKVPGEIKRRARRDTIKRGVRYHFLMYMLKDTKNIGHEALVEQMRKDGFTMTSSAAQSLWYDARMLLTVLKEMRRYKHNTASKSTEPVA